LAFSLLLCAALSCSSSTPDGRGGTGASTATGATSGQGPGQGGSSTSGSGTGATGAIISFAGTAGSATCTPDTGPYCGDLMVNQASETCDDGNALPGDGCTGLCAKEPNFDCPAQGGKCTSTLKCGDGKRSPGEACDDGNVVAGDGCSADCSILEPGWYCPTAGMPCMRANGVCGDSRVQPGETCDDGGVMDGDGCGASCRVEPGWRCTQPGQKCQLVPVCGNGTREGTEECDDTNMNSADGCSSTCHVEPGFLCPTAGQPCKRTVCGDGKREGSECCDDGNKLSFDGCTPDCTCEPECPATGACTSRCGNGIVEGGEVCDDGNLLGGDGCSATCQTESGFACAIPECTKLNGLCTITVPAVFRDFNGSTSPGGHPDFQPGTPSHFSVAKGLVQATWDAEKKPVFSGSGTCVSEDGLTQTACAAPPAFIHSVASFKQWYRDDAINSKAIPGTIRLWDNGKGGYVNRFGPNGEQFAGYPKGMVNGVTYPEPQQCDDTDCTGARCATVPAGMVCLNDCVPWGDNKQACFAVQALYDGNPLFFPLDPVHAGILTDSRWSAKVPAQYGYMTWPWEQAVGPSIGLMPSGVKCDAASDPNPDKAKANWCHNFGFTTEVKYWFRYDSTVTARLDFTGDDDVWVFVNGKLAVDLGGWHVPLDGSVTIDSASAASYGLENGKVYQIGVFQAERQTEGSSFRLTLSGFNLSPSVCTPKCGDGVVTVNEECDAGAANSDGACGACKTNCTFGPRCGDSVTQADCAEECDDGVNIGGYNQCGAMCKLAERCGDGVTQAAFGEQCDDGAMNGMPGHCTTGCGVPGFCGDGVVQAPEECDNGINDNSYGGCSSDCHFGPRCGDSVVQKDGGEDCDLGAQNQDGVYGGCTPRCELGPHCGDGLVQGTEQCDPGNGMTMAAVMTSNAGCTSTNSTCDANCRAAPVR
jgi:fibro-slime domain-containing protein